jgi:RNA recognition motif-containing protein
VSKKIFIGGLSWGVTEDELRSAFEDFGEIKDAKVVMDRETGRSRGFGFVTFLEEDAAEKAIAEMNGANLEGRPIRVSEAEEKKREGGGGRGFSAGGGMGRREFQRGDRGGYR